MYDNDLVAVEKILHDHQVNRSNFKFVVWEIVAAGAVAWYYFDSLGIGIIVGLGIGFLFGLAAGRPTIAAVVSLTLGAGWTFFMYHFYLTFDPSTLTLWVLTGLTFLGAVAIHGSAFQYSRQWQQA